MFLLKQKGWIAVALLIITMQTNAWAAKPAMQPVDKPVAMTNEADVEPNRDPLERYNRSMFVFNEKFDYYILKPLAEIYTAIMPKPLNEGIHNIFVAISEPATIVNDMLQFNFTQSAKDMSRLAINLTAGIGCLFDVAERLGLPHFSNDFGLTMAYWGYTDSSYLILPLLGPNTIRDGIGIPVDYYNFYVYPRISPFPVRFGVLSWFFVDYRAHGLVFEPVLLEVAVDKYVFMRNAYLQRRAYQLEQLKQHPCCNKRNSKENQVMHENS